MTLIALLLSVCLLVSCGKPSVNETVNTDNEEEDWDWETYFNEVNEQGTLVEEEVEDPDASDVIAVLDADSMFTNNELTLTYDEADATTINLSGDSVTITEEGTYILSGEIADGQIIVDVSDSDKVHLVLDNVSINSSQSAAIYIKDGDKVFITLADGSYNSLSTTGEFVADEDENVDGVIYSKSDISFMGEGALEITTEYGHGIVGKDDVVFTSGTYIIEASSHGIKANDSIRILDGTFSITSGKDGMQAENTDDYYQGYIYIAGGTFEITAQQDGITSSSLIQIDGGTFQIYSGGGFVEVLNDITMGEGSGNTTQVTDTLAYSMKCLKAFNILINDGAISLSAYEDAFHANNELTFNGGDLYVLSGDDALHADVTLTINELNLEIADSYEGIEAFYIYINGGNLIVNAYDDAMNATDSKGLLEITGGTIYISCVGDGLDSNGDLTITGGDITIDCNPIYSGGDGEIDVSGTVTYTGGTIVDDNGDAIDPSSGFTSSGNGNSMGGNSGPGSSNNSRFSR